MKHLFILLCLLCSHLASAMTVTLSTGDARCGNSNGWIEASVFGGVSPYTYMWNTGSTMARIDGLAPGTYTILVTDAVGDTVSETASISNIQSLAQNGMTFAMPGSSGGATTPCGSNCNGIAYLVMDGLGGTPPYMITSIFNSTNVNLASGNYNYQGLDIPTVENICGTDYFNVTVTDANGCSENQVCPGPPGIQNFWFDSSMVAPACTGLSNGTIKLSFPNMPFIPGVTYSWTGPTSGSNSFFNGTIRVSNVPAGTYTFHMINNSANSCDTTFTITVPDMGNNCGQINGLVIIDSIRNCTWDVTEHALAGQMLEINPGPYYAVTDSLGHFHADLPLNTYSVASLSSSFLLPVCQASGLTIAAPGDSIGGVLVGDSVPSGSDIQLWLSSGAARPGFTWVVYGSVHNRSFYGTDTVTIDLNFPTGLTYLTATLPCTIIGPGQLELKIPTVGGLTYNYFHVQFQIPPNPALIGTTLTASGTASMVAPEVNTTNNFSACNQVITGSYDPNEKIGLNSSLQRGILLFDQDSTMQYEVHFQNTGNDTAFNIIVVDTLDTHFNIASLSMNGASHPFRWEVTGQNILKVYFDHILLPDSTTNLSESSGVFGYSIRIKDPSGTAQWPYYLNNTAQIYFDFNPPVSTNTETTMVDISVGLSEQKSPEVHIYPNPVHDQLTLSLSPQIVQSRVSIVDITGKSVYAHDHAGNRIVLPVQQLSPGMYLLKITDLQNGAAAIQRFTKF